MPKKKEAKKKDVKVVEKSPVKKKEVVKKEPKKEKVSVKSLKVDGREVVQILNDGRETDHLFHCVVSDGSKMHVAKELFSEKQVQELSPNK